MGSRPRSLVVVGASAGGVEALRATVGGLPATLEAAVLVVLHLPANATSALPEILGRAGALPVRMARHGEPMEHGRIYTARPDHHLLVVGDALGIARGPREHGQRPSIDLLFRSAAGEYGPAVTGVLLSGMLEDGVAGLAAIARSGGRTIVQDPRDAIFPALPLHAIRALRPEHVVRAADIGAVLARGSSQSPATAVLSKQAPPGTNAHGVWW